MLIFRIASMKIPAISFYTNFNVEAKANRIAKIEKKIEMRYCKLRFASNEIVNRSSCASTRPIQTGGQTPSIQMIHARIHQGQIFSVRLTPIYIHV